jgi:hypothetical protein
MNRKPRCARRSDDTEAPCGVASSRVAVGSAHKLAGSSLLNDCHPRPVNAYATTNPIESALSVTRRVTARKTRWRDGDMRRRSCAAGLLRAEAKFRRVKGHRAMPALLKAPEAAVRGHRMESVGPVRENARRNHTSARRSGTPPCKRERR